MTFVPAYQILGEGERLGFVLHGILGSGRNWRSFSRRLLQASPDWRLVLVDLRAHGNSGPGPDPQTVAACAADLAALAVEIGQPQAVMGHSFGGKVALAYARDHGAGLSRVHVLDSRVDRPDEVQSAANNDVLAVLAAIDQVLVPAESQSDVSDQLRALGLGQTVTQWLLTSLKRGDAGWTWKLDLPSVHALIEDYLALDLLPWLREPRSVHIDIVRAGRSAVWTPASIAAVEALGPETGVRVTTLPDADHWLHVTAQDALLAHLSAAFRP